MPSYSRRPQDKAVPFLPEGVANPFLPSQPWEVFEANAIEARVDLGACMAFVPRNVNEYTDLIHWHEMGHVWGTEGPNIFGNTEPGVWDHILCEPQINIMLLRNVRVDVSQAMRAFDFSEHPVPLLARDAGILWINLAYYLKDAGNSNLRAFAGQLEQKIREGWQGNLAFQTCYDAVQAVIKDPSPTTRQTWAVKLAEYFNPPPPPPELKAPVAKETADEIKEAADEDREEAQRERDQIRQEIADQAAAGTGSRLDNMEIHQHITHTRPGKRIASPGGARDTGIIPTRFERYCTDKMLFTVRKMTGTLVIDCSGSMAWDWEALKLGLKSFPNVTVACYQGLGDDTTGRLCVIARKGRWSEYEPRKEGGFNYGNTVDYQALVWLSKQSAPRLWLSDGEVCGGNEMNTRTQCGLVMHKAKILRVETLAAALGYFGKKQIPAFTDATNRKPVVTRRKR